MITTFDDPSVQVYLDSMRCYAMPDDNASRALARRAMAGDHAARETLILGHWRLVVHIAKRYIGNGLDVMDLIMAGNEGMCVAVDRYKPDLATSSNFSDYAGKAVGSYIHRACQETGEAIRLPAEVFVARNRARRDGDDIDRACRGNTFLAKRVRDAQHIITSIDLPIEQQDSETLTIADTIAQPGSTVESLAIGDDDAWRLREIAAILASLPPRWRFVILARVGAPPFSESLPYRAIATQLHVSHTRVRQIELAALTTIRERLQGSGVGSVHRTKRGIRFQSAA